MKTHKIALSLPMAAQYDALKAQQAFKEALINPLTFKEIEASFAEENADNAFESGLRSLTDAIAIVESQRSKIGLLVADAEADYSEIIKHAKESLGEDLQIVTATDDIIDQAVAGTLGYEQLIIDQSVINRFHKTYEERRKVNLNMGYIGNIGSPIMDMTLEAKQLSKILDDERTLKAQSIVKDMKSFESPSPIYTPKHQRKKGAYHGRGR